MHKAQIGKENLFSPKLQNAFESVQVHISVYCRSSIVRLSRPDSGKNCIREFKYSQTRKSFQGRRQNELENCRPKCTNLNARLLSKEELAFIYESDQKNEWIQEGPSYWSSQEKSAENAFYMNMKTGYFGYLFKSFPYSVKCTGH